jgi:hypothetical protein
MQGTATMHKVLCIGLLLVCFPLTDWSWAQDPELEDDPFGAPVATPNRESFTGRLFSAVSNLFGTSKDEPEIQSTIEIEGSLLEEEEVSIDEQATYVQGELIKLGTEDDGLQVHAFTLDKTGRLLAACTGEQGEVLVLDGEGKQLATWKLDVTPEAINVAPDGSVLIAGQGKLFRLDAEGKILQQADAPHAAALLKDKQKLREEAVESLKEQSGNVTAQLASYEEMLNELDKRAKEEELNEDEEQIRKVLPNYIKELKDSLKGKEGEVEEEPSDEAIEQLVQSLISRKLQVSSISADEKYVYLATPASTGYAYEVWRMASDFGAGKIIVSDLHGCCGHMDVQACASGIFVAENSRHRVVSYHPSGKQITEWGGQDRTGINGFTSCCNPMNVCFNHTGDVFTAESSTGRIKRFGSDGKFKEFVGDVKLVPGCKNVSIAVSKDDERVYMLDITRNHIVVMNRKPAAEKPAGEEAAETEPAAAETKE